MGRFRAIAFGAVTVLAVTHIHHIDLDIGLLDRPPPLALLLASQGRPLSHPTLAIPLETFTVTFILTIVGDVDDG